jgi:hypothetical protein
MVNEPSWRRRLLTEADLEEQLNVPGVSNQNRALFCLALTPVQARPVAEIRDIAVNAGWTGAKSINMSTYLNRAATAGLVLLRPDGWKLTKPGLQHVAALSHRTAPAASPVSMKLRAHLVKITNDDVRAFVEEAVKALEAGLFRSAAVLAWVGAVALIYDYVVKHKLAEFNQEATSRNSKWKAATNADDLTRMKEHDFLQILPVISIVGKNVKEELEGCLRFRNGCGHPNSMRVGEARTASHIETLILNVFENPKFN